MVEKHILIIQCGSVVAVLVVISKWIFDFLFVITYPKNSCDSRAPPDSPRHHDRATPAPRISPLSPPRKNGRRCPTRRVGGVERRPPGDGSLAPRGGGESLIIRAKRVSNCYIQEKKICPYVCVDVRLILVLVWKTLILVLV